LFLVALSSPDGGGRFHGEKQELSEVAALLGEASGPIAVQNGLGEKGGTLRDSWANALRVKIMGRLGESSPITPSTQRVIDQVVAVAAAEMPSMPSRSELGASAQVTTEMADKTMAQKFVIPEERAEIKLNCNEIAKQCRASQAHRRKANTTRIDLDPGAWARCENTPTEIKVPNGCTRTPRPDGLPSSTFECPAIRRGAMGGMRMMGRNGTKQSTYKLVEIYGRKKCPMGRYWKQYALKSALPPWDKVGRNATCPDVIGWPGFYYDQHQKGGLCIRWTSRNAQTGKFMCERYTCVDKKTGEDLAKKGRGIIAAGSKGALRYTKVCKPSWKNRNRITPLKGVCNKETEKVCTENPNVRQVCQKMRVVHVDQMSRSAGVLMMKRTSCDADGKCSVFKAARCIDLRQNVWLSTFNEHRGVLKIFSIADARGGMAARAKYFGIYAERLLKKYNNNLPDRYACSDTRHRWIYNLKYKGSDGVWKRGKARCYRGCSKKMKNRDATLARLAILSF